MKCMMAQAALAGPAGPLACEGRPIMIAPPCKPGTSYEPLAGVARWVSCPAADHSRGVYPTQRRLPGQPRPQLRRDSMSQPQRRYALASIM